MNTRILLVLIALTAAQLPAQLAAITGNRGVSMGHLHLVVRDVDAQKKFWVALGGTPVKNGALELIEFPGVYVMLRQGEPTAGTVGSVVNHIGFNARNSAESVAKWQAAGIKPEPGNQPGQFYITTSDGALDHIGFEVANLDSYATKLQAQGVDFDAPPRMAPNGTTKVAFLTDPWGTYIELTQGLAPVK